MLSSLLAITLPVPSLLLAVKGRSLAWQIAAVAGVYLAVAAAGETWYHFSRDTFWWDFSGNPAMPKDPAKLQAGVGYTTSQLSYLVRLAAPFAVLALIAWAQIKFRRLFLPELASALFWISLIALTATRLGAIVVTLDYAQSGQFYSSPSAQFAGTVSAYGDAIWQWALLALAILLVVGLLLTIPRLLEWIRHAL